MGEGSPTVHARVEIRRMAALEVVEDRSVRRRPSTYHPVALPPPATPAGAGRQQQ